MTGEFRPRLVVVEASGFLHATLGRCLGIEEDVDADGRVPVRLLTGKRAGEVWKLSESHRRPLPASAGEHRTLVAQALAVADPRSRQTLIRALDRLLPSP